MKEYILALTVFVVGTCYAAVWIPRDENLDNMKTGFEIAEAVQQEQPARAQFLRAWSLVLVDKLEEAETYYQEGLQIYEQSMPEKREIISYIINLEKAGRYDWADQAFRDVLEKDSASTFFKELHAEFIHRRYQHDPDRLQEAVNLLKSCLWDNPDNQEKIDPWEEELRTMRASPSLSSL